MNKKLLGQYEKIVVDGIAIFSLLFILLLVLHGNVIGDVVAEPPSCTTGLVMHSCSEVGGEKNLVVLSCVNGMWQEERRSCNCHLASYGAYCA